jgi:hypothetical protein
MSEAQANKSKRRSLEKLASKKEAILERRKKDEELLKQIEADESTLRRSYETAVGMSFWRFMVKNKTAEYEAIINSPEFDKYVVSANIRSYLGLPKLKHGKRKSETGESGEGDEKSSGAVAAYETENGVEHRVYLAVPKEEKETLKHDVAEKILSEAGVEGDWRGLVQYDGKKGWYAHDRKVRFDRIDWERFRKPPSGETEWIPDGLFKKLITDVSKLYVD